MIKDFSDYIPVISIFIIIVYFLFSLSLKDIIRATESEINNGSNKAISILAFVSYFTVFMATYFSNQFFDFRKLQIISVNKVNVIVFGLLFVIFQSMKILFGIKLDEIMKKERKYKINKRIYDFCLISSILVIVFFSIVQAIIFSLEFNGKIILNTDGCLNILAFFFSICILFLSSGYIFSYGILHRLTKFNFSFSDGTKLNGAYLIVVNKNFVIIKEDYKKAVSIKKDMLEKMEFL